MRPPRRPQFVAPRIYRHRRLMDAARLLPVLGTVLMLVPILQPPAEGATRSTAMDGIYLFAVWALLILSARLLAPRLQTPPPGNDETGDD